jgi:hypothetical protein
MGSGTTGNGRIKTKAGKNYGKYRQTDGIFLFGRVNMEK